MAPAIGILFTAVALVFAYVIYELFIKDWIKRKK